MNGICAAALGVWVTLIALNTALAPGRWPEPFAFRALLVPVAGAFDMRVLAATWTARFADLLCAAAVGLAMCAAGSAASRWLRIPAGPLRAWLIGFGALPPVLLGLGLAGLFRRPVLAGVIVVMSMLLIRLRPARPRIAPGCWTAVAPCLLALPGTLVPETIFDALRYHLALPARYLAEGRIVHLDRFLFGSFPQGAEMLYGTAAAFGTTVAAKLIAWACFVAAVGIVHARLAAILPPATARLIAWAFATMPMLSGHATTAGTDLPLIALETAAFVAILDARLTNRIRSGLRLAAVLWGAALGIKHLAALAILAATAGLILTNWRKLFAIWHSSRTAMSLLFLFPVCWLLKNLLLTGNPIHPYLLGRWQLEDETFRLHLLWAQDWRAAHPVAGFGLATTAAITFTQGTYDAAGETLGLLPFLALGLFAVVARPLADPTRWLAISGALLWAGWVHGGGGIYRYLAPFYPATSLLAGHLLAAMRGVPARAVMVGLVLGLAAQIPPLLTSHGRPPGAVGLLLGFESDTDYLNRALPPSGHRLGALARVSAAAGRARWLSLGDPQAYYATAPVVTGFEFAPSQIEREALDAPDARRVRLRVRQRGISAALVRVESLVSHARMSGATPSGPALLRLQEFWRDWTDPVWTDESVADNRYYHLYVFRARPGPFHPPASALRYVPPGTQLLTMEADLLLDAGRFRDALAAARALADREPGFVGGWQRMHEAARNAGDRNAMSLAAARLYALGFSALLPTR